MKQFITTNFSEILTAIVTLFIAILGFFGKFLLSKKSKSEAKMGQEISKEEITLKREKQLIEGYAQYAELADRKIEEMEAEKKEEIKRWKDDVSQLKTIISNLKIKLQEKDEELKKKDELILILQNERRSNT